MTNRTKIVMKSTESLKFYEKNNKKHPEEQIKLLMANINEFGFTVPLLIDKSDTIIAGHGRAIAAKKLSISEIPCIVIDDLNDKQIKALRIADNGITELGETNWEMLAIEFDELKDLDFDYLTGYKDDDFADYLKDINKKPEESKNKKVDKLSKHVVKCPECGCTFEKKQFKQT